MMSSCPILVGIVVAIIVGGCVEAIICLNSCGCGVLNGLNGWLGGYC